MLEIILHNRPYIFADMENGGTRICLRKKRKLFSKILCEHMIVEVEREAIVDRLFLIYIIVVLPGRNDQKIPGVEFYTSTVKKETAVPFHQVEKLIKRVIVGVRLKMLIRPSLLIYIEVISQSSGVS